MSDTPLNAVSYWQELLVFRPPFPAACMRDGRVQPNGCIYLPSELRVSCPTSGCQGIRAFELLSGGIVRPDNLTLATYRCRNCQSYSKTFAVLIEKEGDNVVATKFGELPEYAAPSSPRLDRLLGDSRDLLRKGQRCEVQGLGIGAFGYYRRVVESQRDTILDETIKAAKAVEADPDIIERLKSARAEREFTRSLEKAADALPGALMIAGQNPLKILHAALSEGLHDQPDERCLELAHSIRAVLVGLVQRTSELVVENEQLRKALGKLNNRGQQGD